MFLVIIMDMNKWNEYEQKQKELRGKFRNKKIIILLIWLVCAAVVTVAIMLLKAKLGAQLTFMAVLFSNAILIFIFFRKISELSKFQKQQEFILRDEEPIGKFKM